MDLARLRRETRSDHEAVESSIPLLRSDLTRTLYRTVLHRLLGMVEAWEGVAERGLPERILPMIRERNRAHLLREDLADLGCPAMDAPRPRLDGFGTKAELLGAMYVMEGSRLGGLFIARHVDGALGLDSGDGSRYFRGFGEETKPKWAEFMRLLETEISEDESEDAIRGAKKMFGAFGEWMRGMEPVNL